QPPPKNVSLCLLRAQESLSFQTIKPRAQDPLGRTICVAPAVSDRSPRVNPRRIARYARFIAPPQGRSAHICVLGKARLQPVSTTARNRLERRAGEGRQARLVFRRKRNLVRAEQ